MQGANISIYLKTLAGLIPAIYLLIAGIPSNVDWAMIILAIALFGLMFLESDKQLIQGNMDPWVAGFVAAWLTVCFFSVNVHASLLMSVSLLPGLMLYCLCSRNLITTNARTVFSASMAVFVILISAQLLVAQQSTADPQQIINTTSILLLVVPNDVILLVICALWSSFLLRKGSRILNLLAVLALLGALLSAIILSSRGALLALLAGFFLRFLLDSRQAGIIFPVALILIVAISEFVLDYPLSAKFQGLWDNRLVLWESAWTQFLASPVFGQGPFSFGPLHEIQQEPRLNPQLDQRSMPWPHNLYLELLAAGGLILFSSFLLLVSRSAFLLKTFRKADHEWFAVQISALIALLIAGIYELSFVRLWFSVIFFLQMGLIAAGKGKQNDGEPLQN